MLQICSVINIHDKCGMEAGAERRKNSNVSYSHYAFANKNKRTAKLLEPKLKTYALIVCGLCTWHYPLMRINKRLRTHTHTHTRHAQFVNTRRMYINNC